MAKPFIRKQGRVWVVIVNGRAWSTRGDWGSAITHGNRIAEYAHTIRQRRDIERIHDALARLEENR